MPTPPTITAVIPAYNPERFLLEAVASVERQTWAEWECVVVDDGTDRAESLAILRSIEERAHPRIRVVRQPNKGLAAARNTGFREAAGEYVVPLDADDLLEADAFAVCHAELGAHPGRGYAYFDYRVFGDSNRIERPGEYNLYRLLDENYLPYCCFVPKRAWEAAGGYDEWHRWGYEDWSFHLNLGKRDFFGHYIPRVLFRYRTHGRGLHYIGLERHATNWAHMEQAHAEVLSPEGRLRVKRRWAPSICVVASGGAPDLTNQTLLDYQVLENVDETRALAQSAAPCFLWMSGGGRLRPQALEECVWALRSADWATWKDTGEAPPPSLAASAGPLGVSRAVFAAPDPKPSGLVRRLAWRARSEAAGAPSGNEAPDPPPLGFAPGPAAGPAFATGGAGLGHILVHLQNAELLSLEAWRRRPLASLARLIPLRWKEAANRLFRRPVFDLSFYLRFQPRSAVVAGMLVERLEYVTPAVAPGRQRMALITPHLGVGGAETVLLELARQIDRRRWEILLLATQSRDRRLLPDWREAVDWIYDLEKLMPLDAVPGAVYSIALNWRLDALVVQNSLAGYSALPAIKEKRPQLRVADLLHAVDADWDFVSATLDVAQHIDRRVTISEAGRQRLLDLGTPEERIQLIPNGVDVRRFDPLRFNRALLRRDWDLPPSAAALAFVGRLDRVKRPLLLPEIAREILRLDPRRKFVFLVAGDGPEEEPLISRIGAAGLEDRFELLGHVEEPAEVLSAADLLLVPSIGEGVPLAMLEALAMKTPVVACRAGAIEEALPEDCGVLVEPGRGEETRFAEEILALLDDRERMRRMGEAGRALVARRHSLAQARAAYRRLVEELAGSSGQPSETAP